jgi:alpha-glucuronidase
MYLKKSIILFNYMDRQSIRIILLLLAFAIFNSGLTYADNGYKLWLEYAPVKDPVKLQYYRTRLQKVQFNVTSETQQAALNELSVGFRGMFGIALKSGNNPDARVIIGTQKQLKINGILNQGVNYNGLGNEGYLIKTMGSGSKPRIIISAKTDIGLLYAVYYFLHLLQTNRPLNNIDIHENPRIQYRVLDHWDNLNRTVERGYAGASIWNWQKLPGYIDQRYIDYARANASIGINGTVLNNVNASPLILTPEYLEKVKALADVFRPYGLKVFLSVKFSSPIEIGHLKTADPLNPEVKKWWTQKVQEIYSYVPDFGGFLVKANSEGQPGPQSYGRSHVDGANMLADALVSHGGIVMWRAFVYNDKTAEDRAKQSYNEFKPLDGQFRKNVILQIKNGPIDFQPREPFHPLFGTMLHTPVMMEFQLTQEYLGFSSHLVYEGTLYSEALHADTYTHGQGTTVARLVMGQYLPGMITGIAGVANIGTDINWCGHPFAAANWYALGRLCWNPESSPKVIADDWLRMTFGNDPVFLNAMRAQMLSSRENTVNYMTPLGLVHLMSYNGHYGPAPWFDQATRADWNPVYFHRADTIGLGFDRTSSGSNGIAQYAPELGRLWGNPETCSEEYLLFFHHIPWNYRMKSGRTMWLELVRHYYEGVDSVRHLQNTWQSMKYKIDPERFNAVRDLIKIQLDEAIQWRDACVLYFQTFSRMPIPANFETPLHDLNYYKNHVSHFTPGISGNL